MKLIALVPVLILVDGERVTIPVGEEVKDQHPSDVDYLLKNNCVEDQDAKAATEKAAAKAEKASRAEFADARQAVLGAKEAITAPEAAK